MIASAVSTAFGALGSRMMSQVLRTPGEQAFIERFKSATEQFHEKQRADREALTLQLEHKERLQEKEFQHRESLAHLNRELSAWPFLDNSPRQILMERPSYGVKAVNLFIYASTSEFFDSRCGQDSASSKMVLVDQLRRSYLGDINRLDRWVLENYPKADSNIIALPYIAIDPKDRPAPRTPHSISTSLRQFLSSEPTIFLHADFKNQDICHFYIEVWGVVDGEEERCPHVHSVPITLDMSTITNAEERAVRRDFCIKALITGFIDLAQFAYRPHERLQPTAPSILLREFSSSVAISPHLFASYQPFLSELAEQVPALAAEVAMDMVECFLRLNQTDAVQSYFVLARNYLLKNVELKAEEPEWHDTACFGSNLYGESRISVERLRGLRAQIARELPLDAPLPDETELFCSDDSNHQHKMQSLFQKLGGSKSGE